MSVDLSTKAKLSFPTIEIEACLRDELIHIVRSRAEILKQPVPSSQAAIVTASFAIDSLDVVEILCKLDELMGFDIPHTVVRAGGYSAIDQAIQHLMPGVEKVWLKRNGGKA
jgi:acyl carrier protein